MFLAAYAEFEEAAYLTQQVGVFEVRRSTDASHGQVVRQVMINAPVHWCPEVLTQPMAVMGNYSWYVLLVIGMKVHKATDSQLLLGIVCHYVDHDQQH